MCKLYMSGFLKTVSSLRQNFFACLPAGREAFAVLEKAGGTGRKPRSLATSCYHGGPQALSSGAQGGSQRKKVEKCHLGSADINIILKNPDIYWARMFWQALQFSCCSPEPVMVKTLSWQLQAGGISLAFQANIRLNF